MPQGLFRTVLDGDSFWERVKNAFGNKQSLSSPTGQHLGTVKLNTGPTLWELEIEELQLHIPNRSFNAMDYPLVVEVLKDDAVFATLKSGTSPMDDFHLEFEGVEYLWKDVSKVARVMELRTDDRSLARVYSKGVPINCTFIDVEHDLPLPVIGLLVPMFRGFFRSSGRAQLT